MSSTVKKFGLLSLSLAIALVSVLASCHAMSHNKAEMTDRAAHQPFSSVTVSQNASEQCCLLASHGIPVSFLASASKRNNSSRLLTVLAAYFIVWRWRGKDQDIGQRGLIPRSKDSIVFRYLQEAFARGIIQPRIYEPAFV